MRPSCHIARKIAATLRGTGTAVVFLHLVEARGRT
jgi:D-arabinose 5-phosphate isomerase GutQ